MTRKNSRAELTRNIQKVARYLYLNPRLITRKSYLTAAQLLNLKVIRSKGTIQKVGGFSKARKVA